MSDQQRPNVDPGAVSASYDPMAVAVAVRKAAEEQCRAEVRRLQSLEGAHPAGLQTANDCLLGVSRMDLAAIIAALPGGQPARAAPTPQQISDYLAGLDSIQRELAIREARALIGAPQQAAPEGWKKPEFLAWARAEYLRYLPDIQAKLAELAAPGAIQARFAGAAMYRWYPMEIEAALLAVESQPVAPAPDTSAPAAVAWIAEHEDGCYSLVLEKGELLPAAYVSVRPLVYGDVPLPIRRDSLVQVAEVVRDACAQEIEPKAQRDDWTETAEHSHRLATLLHRLDLSAVVATLPVVLAGLQAPQGSGYTGYGRLNALLNELEDLKGRSQQRANDLQRSKRDQARDQATADTYAYCQLRLMQVDPDLLMDELEDLKNRAQQRANDLTRPDVGGVKAQAAAEAYAYCQLRLRPLG